MAPDFGFGLGGKERTLLLFARFPGLIAAGLRWSSYLQAGKPAIGFTAPEGTAVLAVASGLVKQGAYRREDGRVEQTIFLDLANGERLVYSFVGESLVQMQQVAAGQPIGRIKAEDEAVKGTNANLVIYYRDAEKQIKPINSRDFRRAE